MGVFGSTFGEVFAQKASILNQDWIKKVKQLHGSDIVGIWGNNDLSGTVLTDFSGNALNGTYHNSTLNQTGFDPINKSAFYDASYSSLPFAGINTAFNNSELSIIALIKPKDAAFMSSTSYGWIFKLAIDANNNIQILKKAAANTLRVDYLAGGVLKYIDNPNCASTDWYFMGISISKINNYVKLYINSGQYLDPVTGLGTCVGNLTDVVIGSNYGSVHSNGWKGNVGPVVLFKKPLSSAEMANLMSYNTPSGILFVGDSKTGAELWRAKLCTLLSHDTGNRWVEMPARIGVSGITTAQMKDRIDADIAAMEGIPKEISINLGANDVGGNVLAANWNTNMRYIINALHTTFPSANIRIAKVWRRACYTVGCVTANGLIDAMYADYSWLKTGINEADFLPGSDDGATNAPDGVHPSAAGGTLEANALKLVIQA